MAYRYAAFLLILLAAPALGQSVPPPADTARPRPPFRGLLPDSLAAQPTPGGTLRLNGREQPARPFLTIQDQLRTVAGVQVTPFDGTPGSGSVVRIRGASVAQGLSQPLYVIDGLPALNDDLSTGQYYGQEVPNAQTPEAGPSPLQLLPPAAIASVEVLAGPAAVARYGPLGANGVISIRTRTGQAGRPLRLRYAAYAGLQQLRQRYDLLDASGYAAIANEASLRNTPFYPVPFASTSLGAGTDWQDETYRVAGLQQHQLSLDGGRGGTTYLVSADYRRQAGILRGSDLTRLGLRLALGQQLGPKLRLHGSLALGQSSQRLPLRDGAFNAPQAALLAPPTEAVGTAAGDYSGYQPYTFGFPLVRNFTNPRAIIDYCYSEPRTRRLLGQVGATYALLPQLTLEAGLNFQRTLLAADSYNMEREYTINTGFGPPRGSYHSGEQSYRASAWAGRLALRYQRRLGQRHQLGAELDYQYQGLDMVSSTTFFPLALPGIPLPFPTDRYDGRFGSVRLHRPWAHLHYTLDSTLTVEAGLSYAHYKGDDQSNVYPSAQVSWQSPARTALATRLWLGLARTSTFGRGGASFLPGHPDATYYPGGLLAQPPALRVDQAEAGLRLASRRGHLTGQLVAYQRRSFHSLMNYTVFIASGSGQFNTGVLFAESNLRNQGLELTLTADWQRGRLHGSTRLAGSLNRNRYASDLPQPYSPLPDNEPVGSYYGLQQDGLQPNGTRNLVPLTVNNASQRTPISQGIPPQLLSLSQQLRLGRLALDAQLDGLFGYQLVNYQLAYLDTPTGYTNSATTVRDRWTPSHQNTDIPVAGSPAFPYYVGSDETPFSYQIENASHIRLSSLTLTYRLRQTTTQDLSVWVGGQNLFVLSTYRGYDPNVSTGGAIASGAGQDYGAVPVPRTWLLGVSAGF